MRGQFLLRLYPRAWRERYGEELSGLVDAQRHLNIASAVDLFRGALDAHLHPIAHDLDVARSSKMADRSAVVSRLAVVWSPMAAVLVGTAMVLVDFWFGRGSYLSIGFSPTMSRLEQMALPRVRYFPYDERYDLVLHLAMLALAFGGALIFAALARRAIGPGRTVPDRSMPLASSPTSSDADRSILGLQTGGMELRTAATA
jgi:hypothetical protein